MQDIVRLTPTALAVLEALGRFQYLTTAQMMRLGITKSQRHLYDTLRTMSRSTKAAIKGLDFGVMPQTGRLPILYFLTKRGAGLLSEAGYDPDAIRWPQRVRIFGKEYFHRVGSVDFHIAANQSIEAAGGSVDWFLTYYDRHTKQGGRFAPPTLVEFEKKRFEPDAVFQFTGMDGSPRLCCYELHRGRDIGRLIKQVNVYAEAIQAEAIENTFSYHAAARVLLVLDDANLLPLALSRLRTLALPDDIAARFYISTKNKLNGNILRGWSRINQKNDNKLV